MTEQLKVLKGDFYLIDSTVPEGRHVKFRLRWVDRDLYAWSEHVEVRGGEVVDDLQPEPVPSLEIPGRTIRLSEAIVPGGHFSWGEAIRNGERMPVSQENTDAIIRFAKDLEEIRSFSGRPMVVTSWYRPPAVNAAVGGANESRHLIGDAIDFAVPRWERDGLMARLDPWWGARGGLAAGNGFIHIDARGLRARWSYPGV